MPLIVAALVVALMGQAPVATSPPADKPLYRDLLARVMKSDPTVDFTAFRMAYAESPEYAPYAVNLPTLEAIEAALKEKDYARAAELATKALEKNFFALRFHYHAAGAYTELGQTDKAEFHIYVLRGIIRSVLDSGNGKSAETAFHVVSVEETYLVLNALGIRVRSQALARHGESSYDKMSGIDEESGEEVTLWFNVDRPLGALARRLEGKEPKPESKPPGS